MDSFVDVAKFKIVWVVLRISPAICNLFLLWKNSNYNQDRNWSEGSEDSLA